MDRLSSIDSVVLIQILSAVVLVSSLTILWKAVRLRRAGTPGVAFLIVFGLAGLLGSVGHLMSPVSPLAQNALLFVSAVLWIIVAVRLTRERLSARAPHQ